MGKSPLKRRRNQAINELQNLKYLPRRYLRGMIRCILDIAQLLKLIIHIQQISNYYSMFSAPLNAKLCLKTALLRMQVAHPEKLKLGVLIKFTIFQKYLQFKISLRPCGLWSWPPDNSCGGNSQMCAMWGKPRVQSDLKGEFIWKMDLPCE